MAEFVLLATIAMVLTITKVGNAGVRSISSCGLFGINPDSMDLFPNTEYTSALSSPLPLPGSVSTSASIFTSKPSPNLIFAPASNDKVAQSPKSAISTPDLDLSAESATHRLLSSTINSSVMPPVIASSTPTALLPLSSSSSTSSTSSEYTPKPLLDSNSIPAGPSSNTAVPLLLPRLTPTTQLFLPSSTTERSFVSNLSHLFKPFLTEFPSSTSSPGHSTDLFIPSEVTPTPESSSYSVPENNINVALLELLLKLSTELDQP